MLKRSLLTLSIITILAGCSLDGQPAQPEAPGPAVSQAKTCHAI